jgi:phosphoglycolate phosphatase
MNRHVLFDLDGTLVDSLSVCTAILNDMLVERRLPKRLHAKDVRPYMSVGGAKMVSGLLPSECGNADSALGEFRSRYAGYNTPVSSLYPGVWEGLRQLRDEGVTLAVCSNKPQSLCDKVLKEVGLASLFSVVVGGAPGVPGKPAPDLFLHALKMSGGRIDRCCFVGDGAPDHAVSKTLGVPFVFVTYGYAEPDWNFGGAMRCDSFADVPALVRAALRYSDPRMPTRLD